MKLRIFHCLLIALIPTHQASALASKPVLEALEELGRLAGRAPSHGAAEALEAAFRTQGHAALDAAQRGGLGLVEAAARHGDEVFRLATRVPEAAPALAARAGELLPLVARHGDDVLRIEAKLPGVATDLCRVFPHADDLARLARLQPQVLQQTAAYSTHAVNPAASRLLLRMAERQGGAFLKNLSPGQILASGLSLSAVITAAGGFTAFWRYPDQVIPIVKDLLLGLCGPAAQALAWMTFLVGIVIALALAEKLGVLRLLQRSKA